MKRSAIAGLVMLALALALIISTRKTPNSQNQPAPPDYASWGGFGPTYDFPLYTRDADGKETALAIEIFGREGKNRVDFVVVLTKNAQNQPWLLLHAEGNQNEADPDFIRLFEWRERRMFWRPWRTQGRWEFAEDITSLFLENERDSERRVLNFFENRYRIYLEGHDH